MIVDSSAMVAVVLEQPGYEPVLDSLVGAQTPGIGTPTLVETGIVLTAKLGSGARAVLARLIEETGLVAVPFGDEHWREAAGAHGRFGKGRHAAGLNFGDCITYAVARLADEPLLCLGEDFAKTDLALVFP